MAIGVSSSYDRQSAHKTTSTQKFLTQEAIDKLIYDTLAADSGLASLTSGESVAGGYGSTVKAQLAQDMTTKLIGELANVTAETVTQEDSVNKKASGSAGAKVSVICTALNDAGLLEDSLYYHERAQAHFKSLPSAVVRGYHFWAIPLVEWLRKHPRILKRFLPAARSRYQMIVQNKFKPLGALTIYVGQPICYLIGVTLGRKSH